VDKLKKSVVIKKGDKDVKEPKDDGIRYRLKRNQCKEGKNNEDPPHLGKASKQFKRRCKWCYQLLCNNYVRHMKEEIKAQ
jgi:hypothetical protein